MKDMSFFKNAKMPGGGKLGGVLSMLESRLGISYDVTPKTYEVGEHRETRDEYDVTLSKKNHRGYTYYITEEGDLVVPFKVGKVGRDLIRQVTLLNTKKADSGLIRILENERVMDLVFGLPPIKSENQLKMILDIRGK